MISNNSITYSFSTKQHQTAPNSTKQYGFGLIEVLIALVILSVGFLILGQFITTTMKSGKRISNKLDFDNVGMLITRLLSNSSTCGVYFGNLTFLSDPSGLSSQVISNGGTLSIHMPGDATNIVAKPGSKLAGTVKTDTLVIRDIVYQSDNNYLAKVHLEASDSTTPTGLPLTRDFSVNLLTQDVPLSSPAQKKIMSCTTSSASSSADILTFDLTTHDTTKVACINDVDLTYQCSGIYGCTVRLKQYRVSDDYVYSEFFNIFIEQPSFSNNSVAGLKGITNILSSWGQQYWEIGTATKNRMRDSWLAFYMRNYNSGTCPGLASDGPVLPLYHFSFHVVAGWKAHWTIEKDTH